MSKDKLHLVAVRDELILRDIVGAIQEHDPGADVIAVPSLTQALRELAGTTSVGLVLLEVSHEEAQRLGLDAMVRERSGRLVLMGNAAEDYVATNPESAAAWPVLERPFTSAEIIAFLPAGDIAPA